MYFGWYIVAASMFIYTLVIGCTYSAFGLFVIPVTAEFKMSRADMNTGMILLNIGSAFIAPVIGRMLDHYPARRTMAVAAALFGLAFVTLGLSQSPMLSAAVMAIVLPVAVIGAGTLTVTVILARWFVAQRGRVMLLAALGMSGGNIVVVPIIALLIDNFGWRFALIALGSVVMALLLLIAWLIREAPGPDEHENAAAASASAAQQGAKPPIQAPSPLSALLRVPELWLLGIGCSLLTGMSQAIFVSIVPLAMDTGLSLMQATTLISVAGVSGITGKLLLAVVADKLDRIWMLTGFAVAGIVLNLALLGSTTYALLALSAAFLGFGTSAMLPVLYAHLADRFGRDFGTVRGMMVPMSSLLGALGVRFAGDVFDWTGRYDMMFICFAIANLVAAMLIFSTRFLAPPRLAVAVA